jgi:tetratricopeptide (TPR) repeat protein
MEKENRKHIDNSENQRSSSAGVRNIASSEEVLYRRSLFAAAAVAVISGIVYMTMAVHGVLPWQADLLAVMAGVKENLVMRHFVWRKLIGFTITLGGSSFVMAVNLVCAIISAAGAGMLVLVVSSLLNLMIDRGRYSDENDKFNHRSFICLLGGTVSGLTLAFSAPYWMAAAQPFFDSFYLTWLLIATYMLLRFGETSKLSYLYIFFFLYAAGMTQTSSFIALALLYYGYAVFTMWSAGRLRFSTVATALLLTAAGGLVLFLNAANFYGSEGYILLRNTSYVDVVKKLVQSMVSGITGGAQGKGWMIPLVTCVAPFLAFLLTGFRSLNGERDWSFYVLNVVILGVTLAVLLETAVSPWQFFNVGYMQILPYAMSATVFGSSVAYLYTLSFNLFSEQRSSQRNAGFAPVVVRVGSVVLSACLIIYTIFNNFNDANHKRARFIWEYVDTLLDNLEGRSWLVTNGAFDSIISIQAKERGEKLNTLDLSRSNNRIYMAVTKEKFTDVRLRNAAEIGLFPLVQEFVKHNPTASTDMALSLLPDLWSLGAYHVYPYGLAFFGADNATIDSILKQDLKSKHFAIQERLEPFLNAVSEDNGSLRVAAYKQLVKGQVSFIGNNLGYLLETAGRLEEAFEVYKRVHEFDSRNISALLNYASMIQKGMHPELRDEVMEKLASFQESLESPHQIWTLASSYGYVSSPEAFAQLGWTWAMSGMQNLALTSLSRAMENVSPEKRGTLRAMIAEVHMQGQDIESSEKVYKEILAEDPGDHRAIMGMVRLSVIKGDAERAQEYLKKAREAGVPETRIIYETAALEMTQGEIDRARILAHQLAELDPNSTEAQVLLCLVYSQIYSNAQSKDETANAEKEIKKAVDKISVLTEGEDNYQVLFLKGHVNTLFLDYPAARENFRNALKYSPSANVVSLMEYILKLDFALADKKSAEADAKIILHRDPDNAFANYILGSLALSVGNYESSEAFLERSLNREVNSVLVLNDLAVAKLKLGKIEEAEALIRKSFSVDNQLYAAWDTLGMVLMEQNRLAQAEEAFLTALRLNERDLRIHLHVAQVYFKKGEIAKSREIMSRLSFDAEGFEPEDVRDFKELEKALQLKRK